MESWARSRALHADVVKGCDNPYPLQERRGGFCIWTVPNARGSVVLVGDSNAGHFTEPVVRATRRAGFNLTVVTFSSCAFVNVGTIRAAAAEGEALCRRFTSGTLQALLRLRPNLVITAARSDEYIEDPSIRLRDSAGRLTGRPGEKAQLWEQGLENILAQLGGAGVPVLVIQPVPAFPQTPDECTTLGILTNGCASSVSRVVVDRRLGRAKGVEREAVAAVPNADAIDFEDEICTEERCSTSRDGTILYRDADHLSVDGALGLTDDFYRTIIAYARP
jgi:hypothetical protein